MKRYEIYTVLSPELTKEGVEALDKELESALAGANFKVERKEIKIHQPLAYPIKRHRGGSTIWAEVTTESDSADVTAVINKKFFNNEKVLRSVAFSRKAPTPEPGETEGVIGELRRRDRLSRRPAEPSQVQEPLAAPILSAPTKVDVEEIDRRIEELLQ